MYLVRPDLPDEEIQALMGRVADTIGQIGGAIDLHDIWERRALAYEIDGCKRGTYIICYFNAESTALDALRQEMELEEQVLRHVIVVPNPKAIWRPVSAAPEAEAEAPATEAEAAETEGEAEVPAPEAEEAETVEAVEVEAAEGEAEAEPVEEATEGEEATEPEA